MACEHRLNDTRGCSHRSVMLSIAGVRRGLLVRQGGWYVDAVGCGLWLESSAVERLHVVRRLNTP